MYQLALQIDNHWQTLSQLCPTLNYPEQFAPSFNYLPKVSRLLHGSCRNPHHPQPDALALAEPLLNPASTAKTPAPSLLMLAGDQIYADDVAGPMLWAIHQVIAKLELFDEEIPDSRVNNSQQLFSSPFCYYARDKLLPRQKANRDVIDKVFGGASKPIFTSVHAKNHLVTLSEMLAMYLLCWSDIPWQWVDMQQGKAQIPTAEQAGYHQQQQVLAGFAASLPKVRRALAHIPCYMIFDDHDVSDDWNLTRGWEEAAYGHPFSRQVIGNALIAYLLCQGWGNRPDNIQPLLADCRPHFGSQGVNQHSQLINCCAGITGATS